MSIAALTGNGRVVAREESSIVKRGNQAAVGETMMRTWKFSKALPALLMSGILLLIATGQFSPAKLRAQGPGAPAIGHKHIYSETVDPRADIAAALKDARRTHRRVILDFGGDWCGDCQVLDIYFHQQPNGDLLEKKFVLVHVWIGRMDKNIDLAAEYGVPIARGVPALAVLDANGKVLYAQKTGEFNKMRDMDVASVREFLTRWKA